MEQSMSTIYGVKFREPDERRVRLNEDGTRKFDIKQLWQRSHEILNLALLGHKNTVIAEMLDITPQTVSNTLNSSLGMEVMGDKRQERDEEFKELHDKVMSLTRKSLEVYDQILKAENNPQSENFNPNPEISMKMKKETADTVMLELSGMRAPTRIDSRSVSTTLTAEELAAFKQRGMEVARSTGKLVEIDEESN